MKYARQLIDYALYRAIAFAVPLVPRRVAVAVGRRLGGLYCLLDTRGRRTGMENLRRVFPDRTDLRRLLQRAMRQSGVALIDALWSARLNPDRTPKYFEFPEEHARALAELAARGRGVIIATAHFGSWEMLNLAAGALGLPRATVIARPVRNPLIDRHMRRMRERNGNRLVYRDRALPACIGALRKGELVCSVIDMAVRPEEGGIFVDFCGTPALTSGALAMLAVRRRAPLAFAVCRPLGGGRRYVMEAEEIEVRDTEDRDAEVVRVTAELNRKLEQKLRAHPEAWIWNYKRWKWRPCETPGGLYPSYALWVHPHW
ncbi:MAG: lysophospholipid acyltransferase family protein [Planctomycetota bacterium]